MENMKRLAQTFYNFFNSVVPSFLENNVPTGTSYPYLTYNLTDSTAFQDNVMQVKIYDKSTSFLSTINLADQIGDAIGEGIKHNVIGGGYVYMRKGNPFAQTIQDDDATIKTIYINIIVQIYM